MSDWFKAVWTALTDKQINPLHEVKYLEARNWYKTIEPNSDICYDDILGYSENRYKEVLQAHNVLDAKADWLFSTGILVLGAVVSAIVTAKVNLILSFPTMICLFLSIWLFLKARFPAERTVPMSGKSLLDFHRKPHKTKDFLAGSFHCSAIGIRCVIDWKLAHLTQGVRLLVIGAGLFFIPLLFLPESPSLAEPQHSSEVHSVQEAQIPQLVTRSVREEPETRRLSLSLLEFRLLDHQS